ncbi:SAG family member [Eimeria mitis]|uniref:SAG family member n=1 Tax=Eimeria mitis TaxID=44415 RepID=U6JTT4_9EIME|nr:SAG family member [Eimeria mitis]CDJ28201.1 SAG family member [Eimeria mitis]
MAPLYKTAAAVCLVTLCGLQTVESTPTHKYTVEHVEADAYLAVNLARNGKLPVHINEVKKEESLVSALNAKVLGSGQPTAENCTALITDELKNDFHHSFVYDAEEKASPDYRQLLQNALDQGLAVFKNKAYPQSNDEWQDIWGEDAGANLAYLLGSNSTTIGCVIGRCTQVTTSEDQESLQVGDGDSGTQQETLTNEAVLFCQLKPAAEKNSAPFE